MKSEMHSAVIAKYSKNREKKELGEEEEEEKYNRRLSPHLLAGEGERNRNNFLL